MTPVLRACALAALALLAAACAPRHQARLAPSRPAAQAVAAAALPSVEADAAMRQAADPTLAHVTPKTAQQINAARPFDGGPVEAMRPFVIRGDATDEARAVTCLTQAVYYEAAREPTAGQQAVAQVVLNRVRHPAYPKSVCGVVYQGSARATGCQFTFTCDGALRWAPDAVLWRRSEAVARRALAGYVDRDVGSATHYHAAYVAPYWAPTLAKMTQVGQHIFYRWRGPWGEPAAFTGRYAGGEAVLTTAVLKSDAPQAPELREVKLNGAEGVRTYKVADLSAPGRLRGRVAGVVLPTRRRPTADEAQRINDALAGLEKRLDERAATTTAAVAPQPAG
jgi:spore germination cell wall hydrolase CwlJ-like protein